MPKYDILRYYNHPKTNYTMKLGMILPFKKFDFFFAMATAGLTAAILDFEIGPLDWPWISESEKYFSLFFSFLIMENKIVRNNREFFCFKSLILKLWLIFGSLSQNSENLTNFGPFKGPRKKFWT